MAKPASGTAIDAGHALAANLEAAWGLLEGSGTSSADATGNGHDLTLASAGYWGTDGGDPVLVIGSANAAPAAVTSPIVFGSGVSWSIAWRAKQTSSGNAGMVAGNRTNTNEFVWMNGTSISFRNATNVTVNFTGQTPTTIADYVMTSDGGAPTSSVKLYKDGTLVDTLSSTAGGATWTVNTLGNGYSTNTGFALIGQLDYCFLWSGRTLDATEAAAIDADPWAMFVPATAPALRFVSVGGVPVMIPMTVSAPG